MSEPTIEPTNKKTAAPGGKSYMIWIKVKTVALIKTIKKRRPNKNCNLFNKKTEKANS